MQRLQRSIENFLDVGDTCSGYLEGPPGSGLSNASTFMVIRCIEKNGATKTTSHEIFKKLTKMRELSQREKYLLTNLSDFVDFVVV